MKHIKTYKIFESVTEKEMDDVCDDIRDILLPLKDDYVNFYVRPYFITSSNPHFIDVKIKDMNIIKYTDEVKQLVSQLDDWDWQLSNNDSFVVLTGTYSLKCPNCGSTNVEEVNADSYISDTRCNDCKTVRDTPFFRNYHKKFKNINELIDLINLGVEQVDMRFFYKKD